MNTFLVILVWAASLYVAGTICYFKGFKKGKNYGNTTTKN